MPTQSNWLHEYSTGTAKTMSFRSQQITVSPNEKRFRCNRCCCLASADFVSLISPFHQLASPPCMCGKPMLEKVQWSHFEGIPISIRCSDTSKHFWRRHRSSTAHTTDEQYPKKAAAKPNPFNFMHKVRPGRYVESSLIRRGPWTLPSRINHIDPNGMADPEKSPYRRDACGELCSPPSINCIEALSSFCVVLPLHAVIHRWWRVVLLPEVILYVDTDAAVLRLCNNIRINQWVV